MREFPHISDYIRVTVGYAIIPSLATVHLGAKICFTTHLTEGRGGEREKGKEIGRERERERRETEKQRYNVNREYMYM